LNRKIRVGVIFGGKSAEHEVSLQSTPSIIAALNPDCIEVVLIGINKHYHRPVTAHHTFSASAPGFPRSASAMASSSVMPSQAKTAKRWIACRMARQVGQG